MLKTNRDLWDISIAAAVCINDTANEDVSDSEEDVSVKDTSDDEEGHEEEHEDDICL